jgi:hypothetical protein
MIINALCDFVEKTSPNIIGRNPNIIGNAILKPAPSKAYRRQKKAKLYINYINSL